jgi:hypothetical protein
VHQAGVVRPEGVCTTGEVVCRHPLQQYGCRLLCSHVIGDADESRGRGRDQFGIRTRDTVEGDTVPDLKRRDASSNLHNSTGSLAAEGHGQRGRVCVPPPIHLGEVQANGLDLNDRLPCSRLRIRDVLVDHAFWPTCFVDSYCFHGNPP